MFLESIGLPPTLNWQMDWDDMSFWNQNGKLITHKGQANFERGVSKLNVKLTTLKQQTILLKN